MPPIPLRPSSNNNNNNNNSVAVTRDSLQAIVDATNARLAREEEEADTAASPSRDHDGNTGSEPQPQQPTNRRRIRVAIASPPSASSASSYSLLLQKAHGTIVRAFGTYRLYDWVLEGLTAAERLHMDIFMSHLTQAMCLAQGHVLVAKEVSVGGEGGEVMEEEEEERVLGVLQFQYRRPSRWFLVRALQAIAYVATVLFVHKVLWKFPFRFVFGGLFFCRGGEESATADSSSMSSSPPPSPCPLTAAKRHTLVTRAAQIGALEEAHTLTLLNHVPTAAAADIRVATQKTRRGGGDVTTTAAATMSSSYTKTIGSTTFTTDYGTFLPTTSSSSSSSSLPTAAPPSFPFTRELLADVEHLYLLQVGVDPSAQSRGIGGILLSVMNGLADTHQLYTYLETDEERLERYYERSGGYVTKCRFTMRAGADGDGRSVFEPNFGMLRPPQKPPAKQD